MNTIEAVELLDHFRRNGPYKVEISFYAKDELWTLKAYHPDGDHKSCTTSARSFVEMVELAFKKINKNVECKHLQINFKLGTSTFQCSDCYELLRPSGGWEKCDE